MLTLTGATFASGEADLNAGLPDHSSGHPDVTIEGLRARFDWEQALVLSDASISPYVDLSHFRAKLDAYTESGGGFPARFDSRTEDTTELRLGLTADKPLTGDMKLVGLLEGVHRFDESGVRTTGEIVGLFGFDIEGEDYRQNWLTLSHRQRRNFGRRSRFTDVERHDARRSTQLLAERYLAEVVLRPPIAEPTKRDAYLRRGAQHQ